MCAVEYDETKTTKREQEARRQSLHYVLSIYTIWHKCDRPAVSMLVGRWTHTRRLHNHVVYNPCNKRFLLESICNHSNKKITGNLTKQASNLRSLKSMKAEPKKMLSLQTEPEAMPVF